MKQEFDSKNDFVKNEPPKCKWCDEIIPDSRKKSALYCCEECYYAAKMERSCVSYRSGTAASKAIKLNEMILAGFYLFVECGIEISFEYLNKKNFNWGISAGETAGPDNLIGKIVGRYAYHLNTSNKKVSIWKLKSNQ